MKKRIVLGFSLLAAGSLLAADATIHLGGRALVIPAPEGFFVVTKEMKAIDQAFEIQVAPQNTRLATFIPEEFLPAIQRGELPEIVRSLSAQTATDMVDRTISRSDFEELRNFVRNENAKLIEQVKKEMPGTMDQIRRKAEGQLDTKLDLSLTGMVPFPPHDESDRSMAFSMLLGYKSSGPDGQPRNFSGAVTTTFLHVRGCLFFLYVSGGENDLEWTRNLAKQWAASVVAANPPDAASEAVESRRSAGFDWNRVFRGAFIGALVGLGIGLVRWFANRQKQG